MLTNVLEKLGIWDIVAPSSRSAATRTRTRTRTDEEQKKRRKSQESRDEALARKLQVEYDRKFRLLEAQKDAEDRAETQGLYAKKQRVSYIHRGTNTQYDAMIVGVHFDDGPDKPYYTIKYTKIEINMDENGNQRGDEVVMEKQTTPDRLSKLDFDEDKTWECIK